MLIGDSVVYRVLLEAASSSLRDGVTGLDVNG
jgi:hypothetical protein